VSAAATAMAAVRRRRTPLAIAGALAATAAFAAALASRWPDISAAIAGAPALVVAVAILLQLAALLCRTEAWALSVQAAGGTVGRRRLYRASGIGSLGSFINAELGVAARIAALRRSAPRESPHVPALAAAELPILAVEAGLAALASFTLVGPLGLPWWVPIVCIVVLVVLSAGLRRLAVAKGRWLAQGLAITRSLHGRNRLIGLILIAVAAQVARNWMLLRAAGVDASVLDSIALLIALVALGQLPIGPSLGAAASVVIVGPDGVAAAAAAGVLLTATGNVGGLAFAGWAVSDSVLAGGRLGRAAGRVPWRRPPQAAGHAIWAAIAALPAARQGIVERAYFGGLPHAQIVRTLGLAPA
jgi:hypothetical protein